MSRTDPEELSRLAGRVVRSVEEEHQPIAEAGSLRTSTYRLGWYVSDPVPGGTDRYIKVSLATGPGAFEELLRRGNRGSRHAEKVKGVGDMARRFGDLLVARRGDLAVGIERAPAMSLATSFRTRDIDEHPARLVLDSRTQCPSRAGWSRRALRRDLSPPLGSGLAADAGVEERLRRANVALGIAWTEYALSASLMIVLIALLTGITDVHALIALFDVNIAMILFGWNVEVTSQPSEHANWTAFAFGCIAGAVPWIAITVALVGAETDGNVPGFVYGIFVSLFLFFNSFAVNMALQYRRVAALAQPSLR